MKKTLFTIFSGQCLFFFAFLVMQQSAQAELNGIQHRVSASGEEQVVIKCSSACRPEISSLGGEQPRIIFDFPGMVSSKSLKNLAPQGTIVQRIRVGAHNEGEVKTRVVLDVKSLKGLNYTHSLNTGTNQLVVRLQNAETKSNAASASKADKSPQRPAPLEPAPESKKVLAQPKPRPIAKTQAEEKLVTLPQTKQRLEPDAAQASLPKQELDPVAEAGAKKNELPSKEAIRPSAAALKKDGEAQLATKPAPQQAAQTTAKQEQIDNKNGQSMTKTKEESSKGEKSSFTPPAAVATTPNQSSQEKKPTTSVTNAGPLLESIQFDPNSPKGELIQFKLNGFYPPVLRGVESGSPKVICEFNTIDLAPQATAQLAEAQGKYVKGIRVEKPGLDKKLRVFVELQANNNYDLQQVFFKEDNLFVLMVNTVKN